MALERPLALLFAFTLLLTIVTFLFVERGGPDARGSDWSSGTMRRAGGLSSTLSPNGPAAPPMPPQQAKPYYDMVVAVLAQGPGTSAGDAEMSRAQRAFSRYNGTVSPGETKWGVLGPPVPWSVRYVFVVCNATSGIGPVPEEGLLDGDLYHVNVKDGFEHISQKTLALMGLSRHFDFRFLAKTDSDTFPCLRRLAGAIEETPAEQHARIYAGLLQRCGTVFAKGQRLHDAAFVAATGGVVKCHPMYHQGAFYVLGRELVEYLHAGRNDLQVMFNEDAMVGLWLLGVKKTLVDLGGAFNCWCHRRAPPEPPALPMPFYHSCKFANELQVCEDRFGLC